MRRAGPPNLRRAYFWPVFSTVAAALLLGACTSPVQMRLTPTAATAPKVPRKSSAAAPVLIHLGRVEDARPAGMGTGEVGGRALEAPHLTADLRAALGQLRSRSFTAVDAPPPADPVQPAWLLHARIRRFYGSSLDITKSINLVVELELVAPHQPLVRRVVRGRITHANWWNSANEIQTAGNLALRACLRETVLFLESATVPTAGADPLATSQPTG